MIYQRLLAQSGAKMTGKLIRTMWSEDRLQSCAWRSLCRLGLSSGHCMFQTQWKNIQRTLMKTLKRFLHHWSINLVLEEAGQKPQEVLATPLTTTKQPDTSGRQAWMSLQLQPPTPPTSHSTCVSEGQFNLIPGEQADINFNTKRVNPVSSLTQDELRKCMWTYIATVSVQISSGPQEVCYSGRTLPINNLNIVRYVIASSIVYKQLLSTICLRTRWNQECSNHGRQHPFQIMTSSHVAQLQNCERAIDAACDLRISPWLLKLRVGCHYKVLKRWRSGRSFSLKVQHCNVPHQWNVTSTTISTPLSSPFCCKLTVAWVLMIEGSHPTHMRFSIPMKRPYTTM